MAWPTDRRPDDALTGEFVPEIWSARVINHVRSNLVAMNVVNTSWRDQLARGDKLHIPVMAALSATVVDPTQTAAISAAVQTTFGTTAETLTIDKWYEVPVQIDDSVKKQTQVGNLLQLAADNGAYELALTLDTDVNSLYSGLSSSSVYGNDGQTFTDNILIDLMELLDEANVPRADRSLVGDPSVLADAYRIDKFMSFDYSNDPLGGQGGFSGRILAYNLPIFTTNNLAAATTGGYGVLIHREAIGLVVQDPIDMELSRVASAASDLIYMRMLWGADELRDTFGKSFYTRKK